MKKYRIYFKRGDVIICEDLKASYFTSITVPSKIASTTVTFYELYNRPSYIFTDVVKVQHIQRGSE